jgi:hypothetical protein
MKKIYLLSFALVTSFLNSNAQSNIEIKDLDGGSAVVANGTIFNETTNPGLVTGHLFEVKNTSASTKTLVVVKYENLLNNVTVGDKASAYFCWGILCYGPTTFSAQTVILGADKNNLTVDLEEASVVGLSNVRYKVYDLANTSDSISFTIKYNAPVSIKETINLFSKVSDIYPNPTSSKSFINITVGVSTEVKLSIINSLGAVISTKTAELQSGKNTLSLDCESLPTGLYFVSINHGSQIITKKITVSK